MTIVIEHCAVLDAGTERRYVTDRTIAIRAGRIVAVESSAADRYSDAELRPRIL